MGVGFDGVHIVDEDGNAVVLSLPYHCFTYNTYSDDESYVHCLLTMIVLTINCTQGGNVFLHGV